MIETAAGRDARVMGSTTPGAEPVLNLPDLVCRLLCGVSSAWSVSFTAELQSQFLHYTDRHGVRPLLHAQLRSSDAWRNWPLDLTQALSDGAASQAVVDMIQEQEIVKVLKALSASGITPL